MAEIEQTNAQKILQALQKAASTIGNIGEVIQLVPIPEYEGPESKFVIMGNGEAVLALTEDISSKNRKVQGNLSPRTANTPPTSFIALIGLDELSPAAADRMARKIEANARNFAIQKVSDTVWRLAGEKPKAAARILRDVAKEETPDKKDFATELRWLLQTSHGRGGKTR